jgi:soluble lytic murein transglycosylase-like protein
MLLGRASARTCPQTAAFLAALSAAGCAAGPPFSITAARPAPPQLSALEDRALTWHPGPSGASLRGLRLLYDVGPTAHLNLAVVRSIVRSNHRLEPFEALLMATQAVAIARREGLAPAFFCATLLQESGFAPDVLSPAGAVGIAQFTLETADDQGVDPFDWRDAMRGAAELLASYVRAYDGVYPDPYAAALAAYNAGPGTVAYYRGVPPFHETREYIADIYDRWSRILRDLKGARI